MDINLKLDDTKSYNDNYGMLRDALAMAVGARLTLESGCYPIKWSPGQTALRIPAGCEISAENVTLKCTSTNADLFAMFVIDADDIWIHGLRIQGDRAMQSWYQPGYWCLLAVRNAQRTHLSRVRLEQSQKFGMDASDVRDLTLFDCSFTYNGYADKPANNDPMPLCGGMRVTASNSQNNHVTLSNCHYLENGGQGANIGRTDNLLIDKCRFEQNGIWEAHGNQDGLALSGVEAATISRCAINHNLADGMVLTAQTPDESCHGITMHHNRAHANGGNGILLYEHDTPNGGELKSITIQRNVCADNGQMTQKGYPWGFSGIRLGARGFGRIRDIYIYGNACYDSRPPGDRTQMCGIDMLPFEAQPRGGLGPNVHLDGNQTYNNQFRDVNLWELGLVA